jgi:hypothetical protein
MVRPEGRTSLAYRTGSTTGFFLHTFLKGKTDAQRRSRRLSSAI